MFFVLILCKQNLHYGKPDEVCITAPVCSSLSIKKNRVLDNMKQRAIHSVIEGPHMDDGTDINRYHLKYRANCKVK